MAQSASPGAHGAMHGKKTLGWLGYGFVALGVLSILAPVAATFAVTFLVAATMLIWGGLGLWMSLGMRPFPEWRLSVGLFGILTALGLFFLLFPAVGIEVLTLFLVAALLAEGVVSILYGLRLSRGTGGWIWLVASGVAALFVGLVVLIGWPGTAATLLGLLMGLNFLSTGIALLALRRAIGLTGT